MKPVDITRIVFICALGFAMGACKTVRMPKIDLLKSPEFSEEAANIATNYPSVSDTPVEPTDIRSDTQWDDDARALQALRSQESRIEMQAGPSESVAKARYEALKAKAQSYKQDDPPGGPVQGFPDYKPRR